MIGAWLTVRFAVAGGPTQPANDVAVTVAVAVAEADVVLLVGLGNEIEVPVPEVMVAPVIAGTKSLMVHLKVDIPFALS